MIKGFLEEARILGLENDKFEPLVMKVSAESDELAEEICTVLNICKRLKNNSRNNSVSNILGYGMLVLEDFDKIGDT